ncbi:MAG: hypothetical protein OES84_00240 [Kiritimatiellaceae bacterium]|nr:hypothetical protein [Kiritimatiellaceae bacterium]
MSKVLEDIEAKLTGKRFAQRESILSIDITKNDQSECKPVTFMEEYEIVAKFGHIVRCLPESKDDAFKNVYRALRHYIYDDIINNIMALERAWYEQDEQEIKMRFRKLYRELGNDRI